MVSLKFCSNFHLNKRDKNQDNFIIPYILFEFHVGGIGILAYMCLKLKIWLKQSQNEQAQFTSVCTCILLTYSCCLFRGRVALLGELYNREGAVCNT